MPLLILVMLLGIPLLELAVLIDIGAEIGAVSTVILCLATAAVGLQLARIQGLKVMQDMQTAAASGEPVAAQLVHGFFLLIAGVFLFFPGFMTDLLGAILLIPPVRLLIGKKALEGGYIHRGPHPYERRTTTVIIEGDYEETTNDQESLK